MDTGFLLVRYASVALLEGLIDCLYLSQRRWCNISFKAIIPIYAGLLSVAVAWPESSELGSLSWCQLQTWLRLDWCVSRARVLPALSWGGAAWQGPPLILLWMLKTKIFFITSTIPRGLELGYGGLGTPPKVFPNFEKWSVYDYRCFIYRDMWRGCEYLWFMTHVK